MQLLQMFAPLTVTVQHIIRAPVILVGLVYYAMFRFALTLMLQRPQSAPTMVIVLLQTLVLAILTNTLAKIARFQFAVA